MTRIESLLRKEIGLDAASIGSSLIERAVRLRMKTLGMKSIEDYCDRFEKSLDERGELVESVVVNETWFFRDRDSFSAFVSIVFEEWLPRQPAGPLRILSIPCSSGEEPYSLAIALLDAGLLPERFNVDAVDVSVRSLARAKRAVFGKNSFRGQDLSFRDRYFRSSPEGYLLDPRVCGCVHFMQDNLLSDHFLKGQAPYDFVFCRNLLIYFDRPTQAKALARLKQVLPPGGIFFVGPAELPIFLDQGFVSLELPMAFACRPAAAGATARAKKRNQTSRLPPASIVSAPVLASGRQIGSPQARVAGGKPASLAEAQRLADAGKLEAAADICEACLREQGPSARAYYLLGLVRDAAGDPQADDFYRKALYLEPGHFESLWHLALLLEKNGDAAGARAYKRRAERAQKRIAPKS
jgi:chemotaxis protein methyltransferase WspC